jgi:hypothetical protein
MTTEERERLRVLCDKATPGPWLARVRLDWGEALVYTPQGSQTSDECDVCYLNEDRSTGELAATAEFIAAARTALPELLDALETAERNLERERDGNLDLRREYGARDDETMAMFVGRLAYGAVAMREVLESLANCTSVEEGISGCPWCLAPEPTHRDGCIVAAALATDAGAKMLAVVRAARAWENARGWKPTELAETELSAALVALDAAEPSP